LEGCSLALELLYVNLHAFLLLTQFIQLLKHQNLLAQFTDFLVNSWRDVVIRFLGDERLAGESNGFPEVELVHDRLSV
jgi:hypothetical protein